MTFRLAPLFFAILVVEVSPQQEHGRRACTAATLSGRVHLGRIVAGGTSAPALLRLRGGGVDAGSFRGGKKKGDKMMKNFHGSWNVGKDRGRKLKYLETEDGYGISRSRMRREKKKWKRDYGELPAADETVMPPCHPLPPMHLTTSHFLPTLPSACKS